MKLLFYILPVLAGVAIAVQSGVNGQLQAALRQPLLAAFISFTGGTLILGLLLLLSKETIPSLTAFSNISWYKFTGGLLGAFVVTSILVTVLRVGASNMFVLIVAGQLVTALLLDHFGVLGLKVSQVSFQKIIGILLVIAGAYLVNRK